MPLIEDHEEACPPIPEAQLQFVLNLDDKYQIYSRFMTALLIPRPSYAAFFRDLRAFRSQAVIISILSPCGSSVSSLTKEEIKQRYRQVTTLFLQSRWSHPWCRKAAGNRDMTVGSTGWWSAEWKSTGRRMAKKERDAEDRLHQLLLPIWVIMRGRMFPGEDVVTNWWKLKQERDEQQRQQQEMGIEKDVMVWLGKLDVSSTVGEVHPTDGQPSTSSDDQANVSPTSSNPFREGGDHVLRPVKTTPNLRQDFWDSAEAEEMQREIERQERQQEAQVATNAFRMVAAGMLLSTVPKWKLRRLLKSKT